MDDRPTAPPPGPQPEPPQERKPFLLRLPPGLHAELKRWAAAELRSLNGQIEFLLREAVERRRRGAGRESGRKPDPRRSDEGA